MNWFLINNPISTVWINLAHCSSIRFEPMPSLDDSTKMWFLHDNGLSSFSQTPSVTGVERERIEKRLREGV